MGATLTIRLPDDLRRDLERLRKARKIPASDLVREALRRYLAVEEFRRLRAKTVPYARARGILTDEDVFRIMS